MDKAYYLEKYGFVPIPSSIRRNTVRPDVGNQAIEKIGGSDDLVFGLEIENTGTNSVIKYHFDKHEAEILPGNSKVFTCDHPRYYMGLILSIKFEPCDLGEKDKDCNLIPYPAGVVHEASLLEKYVLPNPQNC